MNRLKRAKLLRSMRRLYGRRAASAFHKRTPL